MHYSDSIHHRSHRLFLSCTCLFGLLEVIGGLALIIKETMILNIYYGLSLIATSFPNFIVLRESYRTQKHMGDALGLSAFMNFAHSISAFLLQFKTFSGGTKFQLCCIATPVLFFTSAFLTTVSTIWHKKFIAPHVNTMDTFASTCLPLSVYAKRLRVFKWLLVPAGICVFGFAESRLGPGSHHYENLIEALLGIITGLVISLHYVDNIRNSRRCGILFGLCASLINLFIIILPFFGYTRYRPHISSLPLTISPTTSTGCYAFLLTLIHLLKTLYLHEPFHRSHDIDPSLLDDIGVARKRLSNMTVTENYFQVALNRHISSKSMSFISSLQDSASDTTDGVC